MKAAMLRLGVQPTVVTYNSLISVCVKIGDVSKKSSQVYPCLSSVYWRMTSVEFEVLLVNASASNMLIHCIYY